MKRLFVVMLLILPLSAGAATYSWTDANGTMHFTDDLGSVPKKYRAKALQKAAGEETPPQASEAPATKSAASEKKTDPSVAVSDNTKISPSTRFGDRTAGEWQAEFRALRGKIKEIEQQQQALIREGGDGKTMLTSPRIAELNSRNKQLNQEYEATRLRINSLVEQANKVGLPQEFGQ